MQNNLKELFVLLNLSALSFRRLRHPRQFPPHSAQIEEEKSNNVVEVLHNSLQEITKMDSEVCSKLMSKGPIRKITCC